MRKLGWGWQIATYEYSETMVYKKAHTFLGSLFAIVRTNPLMLFMPMKLFTWAKHMKKRQIDSLNYIKNRTDVWELIGRPIIESEGCYYQDRAIPLRSHFKLISEEEMRRTIDEFVSFTHVLFNKGFIDKSFNLLKNFGVYKNKIILLDLGELFYKQEEVEKQIKNKVWRKHYVLRIIPKKHRLYFIKMMDERFL